MVSTAASRFVISYTLLIILALGWLEYCNSTQDTYYANLRRKNGREEPYNVSQLTIIGLDQ